MSPVKKIQIVIFTILCLLCVNAHAQYQKIENLPKYDRQKFHFGFSLAVNTSDFKVVKVGNFQNFDSLYILDNIKQTGFNLSIVSDLHLGEYFDLRFLPGLSFAQRDLIYTFYDNNVKGEETKKEIESTFLQLPVFVKFKSERVNNFRAYVLAGVEYNIDMVSQAKVRNKDKDFVKLKRNDYGYSIGVGFDFYMEMFKFSPEVRMFNGIPNLKVADETIYARSLGALRSKIFTFSITFE